MRAMWKASLELAELEIPVKLYSAVEERKVHFRLLHAQDRVPVVQRMVDPHTEQEVPAEEIRRGVEIEPGVFVLIEPDELEADDPKPSRAIEVTRVIPRSALDIAWFERPYYLGPDGKSDDYFALAEALAEGDRVGIAHWVMRGKRYFGALEPHDGYLGLVSLHTADEVVTAKELEPPSGTPITKAERELGEQLVSVLAGPFDPSQLRDEYRERVEKLIAAKRRGKRYAVKEAPPPRASSDLGAALRRSIRAAKGGRRAAA